MYKNVLLAIDLEHKGSWKKALPVAIDMCKKNKAVLRVMTVVPDLGTSLVAQYFPKGYEKKVAQGVLKQLKVFVKENVPDDIKVQHVVGEGTVYEAILSVANKTKVDLIILESQRKELKRYLLGPNAARVVRHASCSVLVVR